MKKVFLLDTFNNSNKTARDIYFLLNRDIQKEVLRMMLSDKSLADSLQILYLRGWYDIDKIRG